MLRPARLALHQQIQGISPQLCLQKSFDSFKQAVALRTMAFPGRKPKGFQSGTAQLRRLRPISGQALQSLNPRLRADQAQHHRRFLLLQPPLRLQLAQQLRQQPRQPPAGHIPRRPSLRILRGRRHRRQLGDRVAAFAGHRHPQLPHPFAGPLQRQPVALALWIQEAKGRQPVGHLRWHRQSPPALGFHRPIAQGQQEAPHPLAFGCRPRFQRRQERLPRRRSLLRFR